MRFWLVIFLSLAVLSLPALAQAPFPEEMPPRPPSPIDEFRGWLKLDRDDREKALAGYPEEKRTILLEKLKAYEAMPAEQRERRLGMLELRWYMRPLMGLPPEQRGSHVEVIPLRLHETIQARLKHWDTLDAATRREILANDDARELVTAYFVQLRRKPSAGEDQSLAAREKRAEIRAALARLNSSSPAQREKMAEQLAAFFELPRAEQARALGQLSDAERQEMQKTLETFANLSPEQRKACVASFHKFATMTPAERASFLRNAARWEQMTPQERETWRKLVHKLPPMPVLPPVPPPMPEAGLPMPPGISTASTNLR